MYEITHYSSVNVLGTATLLEAFTKGRHRPRRMIVTSSGTIYGEQRSVDRARIRLKGV